MDIVVHHNLKLIIEKSGDCSLHLKLNGNTSKADLGQLFDQAKQVLGKFSINKFLIEVYDLNKALQPILQMVIKSGNRLKTKIGFVIQQVEEVEDLHNFKNLLKGNRLASFKLFMTVDNAKNWIYNHNSLSYASSK